MIPGVEVVPPIVCSPPSPLASARAPWLPATASSKVHMRERKERKERKKKTEKEIERIPCVVLGCVPVTIGVIFV